MKKNNNKGFMLAETIVISVIVLTVLIIIYTQFISINNNYYESFKYNGVDDVYAVNNIKEFLETDLDNIVSHLNNNDYVDLTSCSVEYIDEFNYCEDLLKILNVKTLLFTYEDVSKLNTVLRENNPYSEGLRSFIKKIKHEKNNKYRLIVEFKDDTFATLKMGSFIVSNISNTCVKSGNTCSLNEIRAGINLSVSVNDNETYDFNVLSDNGTTLTLLMKNPLNDATIWYKDINSSGPITALEYLENTVKTWKNVNDVVYTINGNNASNYTLCTSYDNCSSNAYTLSIRNAKARLPRLQEITNLGCTDITCPSWLGNNIFWTSTAYSVSMAYTVSDKITPVSVNDSINIKPVIVINKSIIER